MALTGVRELSLIATPPVDRLAVRTFVLPYDPVVIREALKREHFRGGQSFYVCPRLEDLPRVELRLKELVPDLKVVMAHGQMSPTELEERIGAFYDGKFDILLATNIVESGLDIPRANTLVIHRADLFGLAQLYQLRGRIGRSKLRGYAYLTWNPGKLLTKAAEQRLESDRDARQSRLRVQPRQLRSRHSRRRQSAGRRTVGPYQGSRHRAVPADAGRSGGDREVGRDRRRGRTRDRAGRRRSRSGCR